MNSELRHFIKNARWFASKGRTFQVTGLRRAGTLTLPDEGPGVAIDLVELIFAEGDSELYQLPLALDRQSTSLNSSQYCASRMPSSVSKYNILLHNNL